MEQLLNTLIEKGWRPFWEDRIDKINWFEQYVWNWNWGCWSEKNSYWRWKSTRQIVSKESWLWQFVCENEMVEPYKMDWIKNLEIWSDKMEVELNYWSSDYEAWIIESSLKDESELEDFLLSNIKVKWKND